MSKITTLLFAVLVSFLPLSQLASPVGSLGEKIEIPGLDDQSACVTGFKGRRCKIPPPPQR